MFGPALRSLDLALDAQPDAQQANAGHRGADLVDVTDLSSGSKQAPEKTAAPKAEAVAAAKDSAPALPGDVLVAAKPPLALPKKAEPVPAVVAKPALPALPAKPVAVAVAVEKPSEKPTALPAKKSPAKNRVAHAYPAKKAAQAKTEVATDDDGNVLAALKASRSENDETSATEETKQTGLNDDESSDAAALAASASVAPEQENKPKKKASFAAAAASAAMEPSAEALPEKSAAQKDEAPAPILTKSAASAEGLAPIESKAATQVAKDPDSPDQDDAAIEPSVTAPPAKAAAAAPSGAEAAGGGAVAGSGSSAGTSAAAGKPTATPSNIRDADDLRESAGNPKPTYPEADRRARKEGTVTFVALVNSDGTVGKIQQEKSSNSASIDQAALAAFKRYKYKPGQQGWVRKAFTFNLTGPEEEAPAKLRR